MENKMCLLNFVVVRVEKGSKVLPLPYVMETRMKKRSTDMRRRRLNFFMITCLCSLLNC